VIPAFLVGSIASFLKRSWNRHNRNSLNYLVIVGGFIEHIEGTFEGVKGVKIYYQGWVPESPKAVVQFVHGGFEHSGRSPYLVNALSSNGYAVYAEDQRGNGKSEGERGYVDSFDEFVDDEKPLYDIIKARHPDLSVFMLGPSLGSLITFAFAMKYAHLLKGVVLAATASGGRLGLFLRFLLRLFVFLRPHMRFGKSLDKTLMTRDLNSIKDAEIDPLLYETRFTIKFAREILRGFYNMFKHAKELTLPLLVQCGTADKIIEFFKFRNDETEFNKLYTMEDKSIKIYNGMYHDVYNDLEPDRKIVFKDLIAWLDTHI